ncbi:FAD-dependent oxidoreductase [Planctomyces sp. SH-PL62]|uniref:FAD-dependent oxidoreductase n=1 Tax=Planctomyces sp. SH-PL62 TaxID=1636152 RepID=UPI00078BAE14|nr:FAD-dependent oxidoreductase [Planctomyces sp. SH-PL62]AMV35915.1 Xanthan lyase precursor [Planctomyces sp. SH-PL62]
MLQRTCIRLAAIAGLAVTAAPAWAWQAPAEAPRYDVVIYGGTSAGVAAAVQASRMGKSVVLIEPGNRLGGLTTGGLGATDIGNKAAVGGVSREFYREVARHYAKDESWTRQTRAQYGERRSTAGEDTMWTFEPHVAEAILNRWIADARIPVRFGERLDLKSGVRKRGNAIESIEMESGLTLAGSVFIDATYEGDLMAKAGVSYHVGREANARYGETLNGVQFGHPHHQFLKDVDPYKVPGDPSSGLLPGVHGGSPGVNGEGDRRVQAYNFRVCLTDVPENQLPLPKPEGYDPLRYELLLRYINAGVWDVLKLNTPMPNRKTDINNYGGFSSDNIGMNYDYPDGDYARRAEIFQEHVTYHQGMLWFLANDPRVPAEVRADVNRWGLCKDEFLDTGGWPHQLYVREARRMISDHVMTQHDCQGRSVVDDAVALAAYTMDSHNVQRFVKDGKAWNEGDVEVGGFPPYPIAYRSIVPTEAQCSNLIVPVCLSASHIAYGSIRMEPVFMVLGQSAATAASLAIDAGKPVQRIDVPALQAQLLKDGQVLKWTGPRPRPPVDAASLPGVVLDDPQAQLTGDWGRSSALAPYVGDHYLHDDNEAKGARSARFVLSVDKPGRYEVRMSYTASPNRARAVPVAIRDADGSHTVHVDQRKAPAAPPFQPLGVFRLTPDAPAEVVISNEATDGHVVVDAVQAVPAGSNP